MNIEKLAAMLLGISLFAASSGITSAYLTAYSQQAVNVVTSGDVKIKLTEPAWNEEAARGLVPKGSVPKNPTVANTGDHGAWIFLKVSVPLRTIRVVDSQSRRKTAPAQTALFSFAANQSWELIERRQEENSVCYVYGFCEAVAPGQSTTPLFEQVELVNYLEGDLTKEELLTMPAEAAAIQDKICPPQTPLADIYKIYLNEEAG